jgi:macrolide transport system ATP-binding/permease protein
MSYKHIGRARSLERIGQDLRFAARTLRRAPGYALVVVTCLALGIGGNVTVFSWMDGILLQPYPGVAGQARLLAIANTVNGSPDFDELSWLDFNDLRRGTTSFSDFILAKITGTTITGGDRAVRAVGQLVSANYFDALGVHLLIGRGFSAGDDVGRGAHPITVISYRLWRDHFRGDPSIVGKTISFDGTPHTIIGVTGEEFLGTFVGYAMQFWAPASQQAVFDPSGYKLDDRGARWIEGFVRLKPGISIERAQAEVSTAATRLATDNPNFDRGRGVRLFPLSEAPFDNAKTLKPMLRVMTIVGVFVLLIVCANVANLLLVRSLSRRHEITVRIAIGSSRGRIVHQLMTEGALLALLGTALGLGLAYASRNVLGLFFAPRGGVSLVFAGAFDWRVLALSVAAGVLSTLLFALVPAIQTSGVDLAGALKSDSRLSMGGGGRGRIRAALVVLQVCLSFVLLVGTGLVLMSLRRERSEQTGFATDDVVTTALDLFSVGYDTTRARRFDDELLQSVQSIPGVRAAALARSTPFTTRPYGNGLISVDGYQLSRDEQPTAEFNVVTPGYFGAMGIGLTTGRDFTPADADTTQPVAVVSEAFATKYWPAKNPIGRRVQLGGRLRAVVGVVTDIKFRTLLEPAQALLYVPLSQNFSTTVSLFIRTSAGVANVAPGILQRVHAIDPNVSPYEILTMREQVTRSTAAQQIAAALVALFACTALFLAAIGLYGLIAYVVSQNARELSLRIAVGAAPWDLMRLVVGGGLRLVVVGSVVGVGVSLLSTRLLGDLLFRVNARDPVPIAIAFAVMVAVCVLACIVPAWRAGRSDPVVALRS